MELRNNFEVQLGGHGAVQRKHHVLCVGKQSCMYGKDKMRTCLLGNIERTTKGCMRCQDSVVFQKSEIRCRPHIYQQLLPEVPYRKVINVSHIHHTTINSIKLQSVRCQPFIYSKYDTFVYKGN